MVFLWQESRGLHIAPKVTEDSHIV